MGVTHRRWAMKYFSSGWVIDGLFALRKCVFMCLMCCASQFLAVELWFKKLFVFTFVQNFWSFSWNIKNFSNILVLFLYWRLCHTITKKVNKRALNSYYGDFHHYDTFSINEEVSNILKKVALEILDLWFNIIFCHKALSFETKRKWI